MSRNCEYRLLGRSASIQVDGSILDSGEGLSFHHSEILRLPAAESQIPEICLILLILLYPSFILGGLGLVCTVDHTSPSTAAHVS